MAEEGSATARQKQVSHDKKLPTEEEGPHPHRIGPAIPNTIFVENPSIRSERRWSTHSKLEQPTAATSTSKDQCSREVPYFPSNPSRQARRRGSTCSASVGVSVTSATSEVTSIDGDKLSGLASDIGHDSWSHSHLLRDTSGLDHSSQSHCQRRERSQSLILSPKQRRTSRLALRNQPELNNSWPKSSQQQQQRRFHRQASCSPNDDESGTSRSSTSSFRTNTTLSSHRSRLERDRNPHTLGVSVHWLKYGFLEEVRAAGLDECATIYDIENLKSSHLGVIRKKGEHTLCPIDNQMSSAYVHALGKSRDKVGRATFMISYVWGYTIGDIIDTLWDHCAMQDMDPKRTYIWICCLCVNQHRVASNILNGKEIPFRTFRHLFYSRAKAIGHILVMMSPWDKPIYITRVWCIFEFFTASTQGHKVTIVMPPQQTKNMAILIGSQGDHAFLDRLFKTMEQTKVEDAMASYDTDKERILRLIKTSVGLCEFNAKVNELMRQCLLDAVMRFASTIDKVPEIAMADKKSFLNNVGRIISFMEPTNTSLVQPCESKKNASYENRSQSMDKTAAATQLHPMKISVG